MKLLFCQQCYDIRKIERGTIDDKIYCLCGKSFGFYHEDGVHATFGGKAIAIGINNSSFRTAISSYNSDCVRSYGVAEFTAFVFSKESATIHREIEDE